MNVDYDKIFCESSKKLCKHCSDNEILCNRVERGDCGDYRCCPEGSLLNAPFKIQMTCSLCGSDDVDCEIITYNEDGYTELHFTCNNVNCGNHSSKYEKISKSK